MKKRCRIRCTAAALALAVLLASGAGCGDPMGTPCDIEGSGFTAKDPCAHKCLARWNVTCPEDNQVRPAVCSGRRTCEPGRCPDGQVCYSFDEASYCIPSDVCFDPREPSPARLEWERTSFEISAATRAYYAGNKRGRDGPKAPAPDTGTP